ncbi:MAG: dTDP-4-dehydrorhamnose 3,5-epimerase [Alphaproteobacteria bacterium]|nr:dTDP-4-dehydrorhamnose 3,5-epimerase [Alphaproteobacteria bacterium]MBU2270023.1 dTDP-4-dehydrorhamnose 3,5-epimerase [Alphaproteobacteria bacterium]MBU2417866.1 dTDP-4-dehydrorhamnose 3,5-epimerase [Alphaproteobacteria bacterium]
MLIEATEIPDVKILHPVKHGDERGYFSEVYATRYLEHPVFVQDNLAFSAAPGTLRGLHFQQPPMAQDKLITALRGAILDVAVDIRRGSPTYGRHVAVELRADRLTQLLVPAGFAHGYCTLEPDTLVHYKVSNFYSPADDRGIRWDDPALGIVWPFEAGACQLSAKDQVQPLLSEITSPFLAAN